ncbi:MAG: helix-turn-helix transcriptional regulator [Aquaticitalea sp.]
MKVNFVFFVAFLCCVSAKAQYFFKGQVDRDHLQSSVYLSLIEDYRKLSGVFSEQIIAKQSVDSSGQFYFSGNQIDDENRIYRIHIDNCTETEQNQNHFDGHCADSKEILFMAKNKDTIEFPFSYDNQIFCQVDSRNVHANAFVRIDSIKDAMKFDYGKVRSEASRELNNKKWFKKLHEFGKSLNEPLAELSIYAFLSDRSNNFHEFYLEDLKSNPYYNDLLNRLSSQYPYSPYLIQYQTEVNADKFSIGATKPISINWLYYLVLVIGSVSVIINIILFSKLNKIPRKSATELKQALTKQEQNILELLLKDKSNKDIAEVLFVSVSTVKTHVNNVYKKLNVQTRNQVKNLFVK